MIDAPIQREIFPAYLFIIIIIPDSEGSFFSCPTFTFRFCVLFPEYRKGGRFCAVWI
jgi:hypothetical protein